MEPLVDCIIEDSRWEAMGLDDLCQIAARATFHHLNLPEQGLTLCVLACDDTRIAALNADFRGKPQPTNVLSWPSEDRAPDTPGAEPQPVEAGTADDPEELGDVALAYETCAREAAEADKPFSAHVTHLIVHGLLHLLGYDHIDDADAEVMEAHEVAILESLGLDNPY
ncbi:rRNA maturation RNase YbeY [Pseudotabrizicola sp. L79]|uniref:rRNA maturation RNase YbeY n=1 Tax=Pseudotabrizicola sp. L79 TaxID=3118402 RepID=UPI002F924803